MASLIFFVSKNGEKALKTRLNKCFIHSVNFFCQVAKIHPKKTKNIDW